MRKNRLEVEAETALVAMLDEVRVDGTIHAKAKALRSIPGTTLARFKSREKVPELHTISALVAVLLRASRTITRHTTLTPPLHACKLIILVQLLFCETLHKWKVRLGAGRPVLKARDYRLRLRICICGPLSIQGWLVPAR